MPPSHFAIKLYRNAPRAPEDKSEDSVEDRRQQAEKHSNCAREGILSALIRNHRSRQANEKEERQEQQAQRRVQRPMIFATESTPTDLIVCIGNPPLTCSYLTTLNSKITLLPTPHYQEIRFGSVRPSANGH